jgi:hypothetical protein
VDDDGSEAEDASSNAIAGDIAVTHGFLTLSLLLRVGRSSAAAFSIGDGIVQPLSAHMKGSSDPLS